MEKDKKYNVVLGLMIFFFLVIVGVSIAWGLGYIGVKNNEIVNNNEFSNIENDNNEISKETESFKLPVYDYTKAKNLDDDYSVSNHEGAIAKTYNSEYSNKGSMVLIYSNGTAKIRELDYSNGYGEKKDCEIKKLNGKVVDAMIDNFSPGLERTYVLLEDGTVQEINYDSDTDEYVASSEGLEEVKNIVRLETIINEGDKTIPVAIDKDGYYYSLN